MTRPNCPSSCGGKRHHRVPYVPSPTACAEINTFITSGKGFSGPRERQGMISFGMCPCLLISAPIIYSCKQAYPRIRLAAVTRHTHVCTCIYCSSHLPRRAEPPVLCSTEPGAGGGFRCNILGTDVTSELSQVFQTSARWRGHLITMQTEKQGNNTSLS